MKSVAWDERETKHRMIATMKTSHHRTRADIQVFTIDILRFWSNLKNMAVHRVVKDSLMPLAALGN
jgi:hypothetical protein